MKVYEYMTHPKALLLNFADVNNLDEFLCIDFDGRSIKSEWSPPKIKIQYKRQYKDFPSFISGKPVISARVKAIIEPYVSKEVEFLPLLHDQLELYMLNVTKLLDCIDWQRSIKSNQSNSIIRFDKQVFDFSKIPNDTYMFKIKENAVISTYITDKFRSLIEKHKIKGLYYTFEFDSEFTLEKEQEVERIHEVKLVSIKERGKEVLPFEEARKRISLDTAIASGRWKMQGTDNGWFILGELQLDVELGYRWFNIAHIPRILIDRLWYEVEPSVIWITQKI